MLFILLLASLDIFSQYTKHCSGRGELTGPVIAKWLTSVELQQQDNYFKFTHF